MTRPRALLLLCVLSCCACAQSAYVQGRRYKAGEVVTYKGSAYAASEKSVPSPAERDTALGVCLVKWSNSSFWHRARHLFRNPCLRQGKGR